MPRNQRISRYFEPFRLEFILSIFFVSLVISACSGSAQPQTQQEFEVTAAFANPMADALLANLQKNDYPAFSRDFTDGLKSSLTQMKYNELRYNLQNKLGNFLARENASGQKYMDYLVVNYTLRFEKAPQVKLQVSFTAGEPHQIAGLQFSSPGLNP